MRNNWFGVLALLLLCSQIQSLDVAQGKPTPNHRINRQRRGIIRGGEVPNDQLSIDGNPQHRPLIPHSRPPYTVFESVWAAWTHWSTCQNRQQLRVRACNTIRGFSCFGHNREARWCTSKPRPTPSPTPPPPPQPVKQTGHEETVEFFVPLSPSGGTNVVDPLPLVDYDAYDPWEEDRRLAMWQLYGIALPKKHPRTHPQSTVVFTPPRILERSNKSLEQPQGNQKVFSSSTTVVPTKLTAAPTTESTPAVSTLTTTTGKEVEAAEETIEPLNVFTRKPFEPDSLVELDKLKNENKPKEPKVLRYGNIETYPERLAANKQALQEKRRRQQIVKIDGNTFMIIVPPVPSGHVPETLLGLQEPIQPQPLEPQPLPAELQSEPFLEESFGVGADDLQGLLSPIELGVGHVQETPDDTVWSEHEDQLPIGPAIGHPTLPDEPHSSAANPVPVPTVLNKPSVSLQASPPGFDPQPSVSVEENDGFVHVVPPTIINIANPVAREPLDSKPSLQPALLPFHPATDTEDLPVPGGYASIGQPVTFDQRTNQPITFGQRVNPVPPPRPVVRKHHGAAVVIGPVIYADASRYSDGPQFQPVAAAVSQGFGSLPSQREGFSASAKLSAPSVLEQLPEERGHVESAFQESAILAPAIVDLEPEVESSISRFQDSANWSAWSNWGSCKCGKRSRTRSCQYISSHLIQGCIGPSYEIESCEGTFCDRRPLPPAPPVPIVPPGVLAEPPDAMPPGGVFLAGEPALRVNRPPQVPRTVHPVGGFPSRSRGVAVGAPTLPRNIRAEFDGNL